MPPYFFLKHPYKIYFIKYINWLISYFVKKTFMVKHVVLHMALSARRFVAVFREQFNILSSAQNWKSAWV